MGRQHIVGDRLQFRQQKTGASIDIQLTPELLSQLPSGGNLPFLLTTKGQPFSSAKSFQNWFKSACIDAGLAGRCSAHGLRKAAARRLAEAGCTPNEIAAITGHKTLAMVSFYTKEADRALLADRAMERVRKGKTGTGDG